MDNNTELTKWIDTQRQASSIAQPGQLPPELHLHHHHAAPLAPTPPPINVEDYRLVRMHPLLFGTYLLVVSVALALPLAFLAAIVESTNRPEVQYIQPPVRW